MRVAVVTAFYTSHTDWLVQCHGSVRSQTHPCTHIVVSDGVGGMPLQDFQGQFIQLPVNHADYGDTPRAIGALSAVGQGFDAVAWLDDDNWFYPQHIESLLNLHAQSAAAVCTSTRDLYATDGSLLGLCPEVDGKKFVDANCLLVTRPAFEVVLSWVLMPQGLHIVSDRWVWQQIKRRRLSTAHSGRATVAFRTRYTHHYRHFGRSPPPDAKPSEQVLEELRRHGFAKPRKSLPSS